MLRPTQKKKKNVVHMAEENIIVKNVPVQVSAYMVEQNIIVKSAVVQVSVNMADINIIVKNVPVQVSAYTIDREIVVKCVALIVIVNMVELRLIIRNGCAICVVESIFAAMLSYGGIVESAVLCDVSKDICNALHVTKVHLIIRHKRL